MSYPSRFSQIMNEHRSIDKHVVITWRAFQEILVDGPETDRIFEEIGDRFLHLTSLDILRAVADLPDKYTRWDLGYTFGDDLTDQNCFGDQLVVHDFGLEYLYILYEYGPEADEPGLIPIADTVPEALGRLITQHLVSTPEELPHPHQPHLHKVANQVKIIDIELPAKA